MKNVMNGLKLRLDNILHAGTGGRSEENAGLGFNAAFLDVDTMTIYRSCFSDGRPAPVHLLDGLPDEVVVDRVASGRVVTAKATLLSGFERNGYFYTRSAAARAVRQWGQATL